MIRALLRRLKSGSEERNYGRAAVRRALAAFDDTQEAGARRAVLDIGAGTGKDLAIAREVFGDQGRYVGVDGWEPNLRRLQASGLGAVRLDVERERLPFEDGAFDVVIANQVLEHVKEIFWITSEMARVLRPEGLLVVGVPNLAALHNRVALLFGMQPTCIQVASAHVRGFTYPGLAGFLERNGYLTVTGRAGSNVYPFGAWVSGVLERLLPTIAVGLVVQARRTAKVGSFLEVLDEEVLETPYFRGPVAVDRHAPGEAGGG